MKLIKWVLIIVGIVVIGFAFYHDIFLAEIKPDSVNVSNPQKAEQVIPPGYTSYVTEDDSLSISLPSEYKISSFRETPDIIFAATTDKVLMTIKKAPDNSGADWSQKDAVEMLYEYGKNRQENPNLDTQSMEIQGMGNNYLLVSDNTRERQNGIKENIRQYMTYYQNNTFIIDFISFEPYPVQDFDKIISTLQFQSPSSLDQ